MRQDESPKHQRPARRTLHQAPGRPRSDASIRKRVIVCYHLAQALARNTAYGDDISHLRRCGARFDRDGVLDDCPWDPALRALVERICRRSGLTSPMLPERLAALTFAQLERYDEHQIFACLPGWTWEVPTKPEQRASLRADWPVTYTPVPMRMLARRHRGIVATKGMKEPEPPDDRYSEMWRVYDLRRLERKLPLHIIALIWPDELRRRGPGRHGKSDPLGQRVHDDVKRAQRVIDLSYPPAHVAQMEETILRQLRCGPLDVRALKRAVHNDHTGHRVFEQAVQNLTALREIKWNAKSKVYSRTNP